MKHVRVLPKSKVSRTVTPPSDLPGRPMVRDFCDWHGNVDPKWIIRDTSGEIICLETWLCGQYVSAVARGCLDLNIRRVVFVQADETFSKGCALAVVPVPGKPYRKLTGQELFALLAIKKLHSIQARRKEAFTPDLSSDGAVIGDGFDNPRPFPCREKARTVARTISQVYGLDAQAVQVKSGWLVSVSAGGASILDPETAIEIRGICKMLKTFKVISENEMSDSALSSYATGAELVENIEASTHRSKNKAKATKAHTLPVPKSSPASKRKPVGKKSSAKRSA